jgi:hypothetical protein
LLIELLSAYSTNEFDASEVGTSGLEARDNGISEIILSHGHQDIARAEDVLRTFWPFGAASSTGYDVQSDLGLPIIRLTGDQGHLAERETFRPEQYPRLAIWTDMINNLVHYTSYFTSFTSLASARRTLLQYVLYRMQAGFVAICLRFSASARAGREFAPLAQTLSH